MRFLHCVFTSAVFLLAVPWSVAVQSAEPWLPVTPADLQISGVSGTTPARAIQLYYSYYRDDNYRFLSVYRRIKILTDAGRDYGDVEIQLEPGETLKELKARTIHPDASIVEFRGKPFEKVVIKARGIKYVARAFTLPEVTAGSIVEYSYIVILPRYELHPITQWYLSGDLYTLKERFRFRPLPLAPMMCSYFNRAGAPPLQKQRDGHIELELDNMAAFEGEEYMPPKSDYQPFVMCYYGGRELASPDVFWEVWPKRLAEFTDKWIGKPASVRDAALQAIGDETRPEEKLRKLYARAQEIRNLSYEPERTKKEEEREKLKPNKEAKDVLQHGYGTHWEVDAVFVGLARATGFDASMLGVTARHEGGFAKQLLQLLWLGQLEGVAALVKLDGKDVFLDPGTRFCPYGMLPWNYSAATALNYKAGRSGFMTTPDTGSSPAQRTVRVVLAADGSAKGEVAVELKGQDALAHRLEALNTDEAGRRKNFEDEIQAWLPTGAAVKMVDSQGWESSDAPLIAKFTAEIPGFASVTGKRVLVPVYPLPTPLKTMFAPASRSYPIDLPFAFTETDEVTIQLPDGYAMEVAPSARKSDGLSYARYEVSSVLHGNQLVTKRSLRLDGRAFPAEKYYQLRNFFDVVHGGDATQAVLIQQADGAH